MSRKVKEVLGHLKGSEELVLIDGEDVRPPKEVKMDLDYRRVAIYDRNTRSRREWVPLVRIPDETRARLGLT
jgi:hypothetical protein